MNQFISQIDELRAQMHKHGNTYALVMALSQQTELNKFRADRRIAAAHLDGFERQRRQLQRDLENVQAVLDASVDFQRLMPPVCALV